MSCGGDETIVASPIEKRIAENNWKIYITPYNYSDNQYYMDMAVY